MMILSTISLLLMMISMMMMMMSTILSKKTFMEREKNTPFECGFDPKNNARLPFSTRFFLIAVIFLIFDVEITLLLPSVITLFSSNINSYYITLITFILILIIGLYHEWNQGALEWAM